MKPAAVTPPAYTTCPSLSSSPVQPLLRLPSIPPPGPCPSLRQCHAESLRNIRLFCGEGLAIVAMQAAFSMTTCIATNQRRALEALLGLWVYLLRSDHLLQGTRSRASDTLFRSALDWVFLRRSFDWAGLLRGRPTVHYSFPRSSVACPMPEWRRRTSPRTLRVPLSPLVPSAASPPWPVLPAPARAYPAWIGMA